MSQLKLNQELLTLKTKGLEIRKIQNDDASFIFNLRSNKNNMKYIEMKPYENIERANSFIENVTSDIEKNEVFFWVIETKDTLRKVGTICLWSFSKEKESAEIGYELLSDFQNKGYANEALNAVLNFAKEKLNIKIVDAITHEAHKASIKLLLKNGFEVLGYMHDLMPTAEDGLKMKLFRKLL